MYTLPGFSSLSLEDKRKYLTASGEKDIEKYLTVCSLPFDGMIFVICGAFDEPSTEINYKIQSNGGKIMDKITKSVKKMYRNDNENCRM